ncbi:hypothetical protein BOQ60_25550, partial [Chryseobacterium sp. CH1]
NMCNVSVPATSLAAYWKFNEGSGSTVQDTSGNGVTLTLTGVDSSNWGTDVPCTTGSSAICVMYLFRQLHWLPIGSLTKEVVLPFRILQET